MKFPKENMWWGLRPKFTEEQEIYLNSIFQNQLTIVNAPAGTGKTTLAVMAARLLGKGLTYVFSPVEEGKMGFRPGEQESKDYAYLTPLLDALDTMREKASKAIITDDMPEESMARKEAWIRACSHTFLRGTNLKNTTLIIAEAQNFTTDELKKVLTRVHSTTTVIMEGHTGQMDIPFHKSGFPLYIESAKNQKFAQVCDLNVNFRGELAQWADTVGIKVEPV